MFSFQHRSIGFQLKSLMLAGFLVTFSSVAYIVYQGASRILMDTVLTEHQHEITAISESLKGEFHALLEETKAWKRHLPEDIFPVSTTPKIKLPSETNRLKISD